MHLRLDELEYSPTDWLVSELQRLAHAFLVHFDHLNCPVEISKTLMALAPGLETDLDALELEREHDTLERNDNNMDKTHQRFLARAEG